MLKIQGITSNSLQQQTIILPDSSAFTYVMYFRPMQQAWFFNSIVYGTFTLNGLMICNNPNMLHQWRSVIPFGLSCFTSGNREPSLQDDFSNGNSILYVLTGTEVAEYEGYLSGQSI